jgi:hypothetical protein
MADNLPVVALTERQRFELQRARDDYAALRVILRMLGSTAKILSDDEAAKILDLARRRTLRIREVLIECGRPQSQIEYPTYMEQADRLLGE